MDDVAFLRNPAISAVRTVRNFLTVASPDPDDRHVLATAIKVGEQGETDFRPQDPPRPPGVDHRIRTGCPRSRAGADWRRVPGRGGPTPAGRPHGTGPRRTAAADPGAMRTMAFDGNSTSGSPPPCCCHRRPWFASRRDPRYPVTLCLY